MNFYTDEALRDIREGRADRQVEQPEEHVGGGAINVLSGHGITFDPPLSWEQWERHCFDRMSGAEPEPEPAAPEVVRKPLASAKRKRYIDPNQTSLLDGTQ